MADSGGFFGRHAVGATIRNGVEIAAWRRSASDETGGGDTRNAAGRTQPEIAAIVFQYGVNVLLQIVPMQGRETGGGQGAEASSLCPNPERPMRIFRERGDDVAGESVFCSEGSDLSVAQP